MSDEIVTDLNVSSQADSKDYHITYTVVVTVMCVCSSCLNILVMVVIRSLTKNENRYQLMLTANMAANGILMPVAWPLLVLSYLEKTIYQIFMGLNALICVNTIVSMSFTSMERLYFAAICHKFNIPQHRKLKYILCAVCWTYSSIFAIRISQDAYNEEQNFWFVYLDAINWGIWILPTVITLVTQIASSVIVHLKLKNSRETREGLYKARLRISNTVTPEMETYLERSTSSGPGEGKHFTPKPDFRSNKIHDCTFAENMDLPQNYNINAACAKIPQIDVIDFDGPDIAKRFVGHDHSINCDAISGDVYIDDFDNDKMKMADTYSNQELMLSCAWENSSIGGRSRTGSYDNTAGILGARQDSRDHQYPLLRNHSDFLTPNDLESGNVGSTSCSENVSQLLSQVNHLQLPGHSDNEYDIRSLDSKSRSSSQNTSSSTDSGHSSRLSPLSLGTLSLRSAMGLGSLRSVDIFCTEYLNTQESSECSEVIQIRSGHTPCPVRGGCYFITDSKIYPEVNVENELTVLSKLTPSKKPSFFKYVTRRVEGKRSYMLTVVFLAYVVCLYAIIARNQYNRTSSQSVMLDIMCLVYLDNILNPFIYFLTSYKWRQELKKVYYKMKRKAMHWHR